MAAMVETALSSQSGVNGARMIIRPESTVTWHLLHLGYLYDKQHKNENLNAPNCASAGHFSAISIRATFPLALQSAETGFQLLCSPTAPHFLPPKLLSTYPVAPTFLLCSWDDREGQAVY